MKTLQRAYLAGGIGLAMVIAMAVPAFAVDPTPAELATDAATGLKTAFFAVLVVLVPLVVAAIAAKKGVRMGIGWISRVFK